MGLNHRPGADLSWLRAVYAAWCLSVPFDNTAKVIALRSADLPPLPGLDAEQFFDRWLEHGVGGTCWVTSNALCELLLALRFDARRVAGSMGDNGYLGHGSVKVRIDGVDWLADSSMLTDVPVPLTDLIFIAGDTPFEIEAEPIDGTHIVWADLPPTPTLVPCRLLIDPASEALYRERYEASRMRSPFNDRLFARRNQERQRIVLEGNRRTVETVTGLETTMLERDEVCESLHNEIGISAEFIGQWIRSGALEASFVPVARSSSSAAVPRQPPSRRSRADGV